MAADLGAERTPEGVELVYLRSRFLVECVAVGVVAIDVPYTFSDEAGARSDTQYARRLGYQAKSVVSPAHVSAVNDVLTPGHEAVERASRSSLPSRRLAPPAATASSTRERWSRCRPISPPSG